MTQRSPWQNLRKRKQDQHQRRARRSLCSHVETLESRSLLATFSGLPDNPAMDGAEGESGGNVCSVMLTAFVRPGIDPKSLCGGGGGTGGGGSSSGEGIANSTFIVPETESNNTFRSANSIPLGTASGQQSAIDVTGKLTAGDLDYFKFTLRGGDIITVGSNVANSISIQDSQGTELGGHTWDPDDADTDFPDADVFPESSPVPMGLSTEAMAVIPRDGEYAFSLGNGNGNYRAYARVYRPVMESSAVGEVQTIFLDFNGATVDKADFDPTLTGFATLSPARLWLRGFGVDPVTNRPLITENQFIDTVTAGFTKHFDSVKLSGANGDYSTSGKAGEYGFKVVNSRDVPDPWGLPNVTRVIIGGSEEELGITGLYGISESVDFGNFDTSESVVVLLDNLGPDTQAILRAPTYPYLRLVGDVVGMVAGHEAGHSFGIWHQDAANFNNQLM
ncbi:MAG: hypothetical protein RIS70_1951, partial [Planctomycetota bacterium]